MVGTADSVLIREMSFIQSVLDREVPLYVYVLPWAHVYMLTCQPPLPSL